MTLEQQFTQALHRLHAARARGDLLEADRQLQIMRTISGQLSASAQRRLDVVNTIDTVTSPVSGAIDAVAGFIDKITGNLALIAGLGFVGYLMLKGGKK